MVVMACIGRTANAQTYTAVSLKRIVDLKRFDQTTHLSVVWGIVIDAENDWIVVGTTDSSRAMTCDELLVSAKNAVGQDPAPGVRAIRDFVPGSSKIRLVYTADIANTIWGGHLARSMVAFNAFADGRGRIPGDFGKYPIEDRVKMDIIPETSNTACSDAKQAFVVSPAGMRLSTPVPGTGTNGERPLYQWIQQVNERMPELIASSNDLRRLNNFMQLSRLFRLADGHTPSTTWKQSLMEYQPKVVYTAEHLDDDYQRSVVESIFTRSTRSPCLSDARVVRLHEAVTAAKRNTAKDRFQFRFQLPQFKDIRYGRLAALMNICKQYNLTRNSYFLDFTSDPKSPQLKIFYADRYYTLSTKTARELWALLRQTEHGPTKGLPSAWQQFRKSRLAPIIGQGRGRRPFLAIVSNHLTPHWFNLSDVPSMGKDFDLVVSKKNKRSFFDAAVNSVKQWHALSKLSAGQTAFIASSQSDTQLKKLGKIAALFPPDRFVINPSIEQFRKTIMNRDIRVVITDLPFNRKTIRLQDGYFTIRDIMYLGRIDHIRLLLVRVFGMHSVVDPTVLEAFRSNGAGMIAVAGKETKEWTPTVDALKHIFETSGPDTLEARELVRCICDGNVVYME